MASAPLGLGCIILLAILTLSYAASHPLCCPPSCDGTAGPQRDESLTPSVSPEPVQPVLTPVRCGAQAVAFHLLNTGPEGFPLAIVKQHSYNYELAAMYVMVLGFFTVYGAGPWSVDEQVLGGEIEFYQGLLPGGSSEEE